MTTGSLPIAPSTAIPRTLGWIHLLFGLWLIASSLCAGFLAVGGPMFLDFIQAEIQRDAEKERDSATKRIADLDEQIAAIEDAKARAELIEAKADLEVEQEQTSKVRIPSFGLDTPQVRGALALDTATGLLLHLAMPIAGIGLIRLRRWGRGMALGLAWLTILQLVVGSLAYVVVIGPPVTAAVQGEYQQLLDDQAANPPAAPAEGAEAADAEEPMPGVDEVMAGVRRFFAIHAGGQLLLGSILPILTIYLLNLPEALAALKRTDDQEGGA